MSTPRTISSKENIAPSLQGKLNQIVAPANMGSSNLKPKQATLEEKHGYLTTTPSAINRLTQNVIPLTARTRITDVSDLSP